ncbi:MAG: NAD-dependent epimerase/dehydratase family protein, partial [Pyrinomonadaceae bacterium]|nr:NAD-dependent epimerase/dehydratase family protein [Pyrinomonadaceae bacterium]
MKVLITGASGLVGTELQKSFSAKGYDMLLASRKEPTDDKHVKWSIEDGFADPEKLEGIDVIVHLAGENVSGLRWTDDKKKAIRDSRVLGTRNVVDAISKLKNKPKTFIASSAIGFYGERGE